MPTIRQLLDRHGRPPRDVALDWAWQIRQQLSDAQAHDKNCLLVADQWTDLEVTTEGQLRCEQLDSHAARSALEDLRIWTLEAESSTSTIPACESTVDGLCIAREGVWEGRPTRQRGRAFNARTGWIVGGFGGLLIVCLLVNYVGRRRGPLAVDDHRETVFKSPLVEASDEKAIEPLNSSTFELNTALAVPQPLGDAFDQPASSAALGQLSVAPSLESTGTTLTHPDGGQPTSTTASIDAVETTAANSSASQDALASSAPDSMREVQQTMQKAEASEAVALSTGAPTETRDTHGEPWVLMRDTLRYRVTVSPKLNLTRQSQWTLAIEPIAGLAIEPQGPVSLSPQGLAIWRVFDADAKPPRACLFVRALHRGREGTLDLVFCGGAEDLPAVSVPLAERWLGPLNGNLQNQAVQLQAALARLSTTVITPEQVPIVLQRKQSMIAQLILSTRLIALMPDINRLAGLADGQVTMHAELRAKPDEPAVATWGRISK